MKVTIKSKDNDMAIRNWLYENSPDNDLWDHYLLKAVDDSSLIWRVVIRDKDLAILFLLRWGENIVSNRILIDK